MPRALFIDDDIYFETLIRADGAAAGLSPADFLFARSDAEALDIIQSGNRIDIAAVAVDSPHVSGMGFFQTLKDTPLRVPRIALVATPDLAAIRGAMNQGAADFLVKPVRVEDLAATLDKVFGECERRRKAWRNESHLAALRREVEVASEIQRRILPSEALVGRAVDIRGQMKPALNMGGDFYDYFELGGDRIALIIADVSGKGIPAAFYMAVVRTLMRASAFLTASPAECLAQVNALLCDHNIPGMFVSLVYGILDVATGRLVFANGGHMTPFLLRREGGVEALDGGGGVVLGVEKDFAYDDADIALRPGDTLFLYTDGLTEAFDGGRVQFSEDRLVGSLEAARDQEPTALADRILSDIAIFVGDAPQSDDMTMLIVRRP